jgi:adenylyl-sulfate kinase
MATINQLLNETNVSQGLEMPIQQKCGATIWLTGLSSAGKTTIGQFLEKELQVQGYSTTLLDGEKIHRTLNSGLSKGNWDEDIRCISFMADTLNQNGAFVIISAVTPCRAFREEMRQRVKNFIEVYVNAPLEVCVQRDVKGFYQQMQADQRFGFTSLERIYEPPLHAEVECKTDQESVAESTGAILAKLRELGFIKAEPITSLVPFHLSISVTSLDSTRRFYRDIIGAPERRASRSSAHFDFFGSQLTCHEVPDYSARSLKRKVDAEDVPVPHFGAALPLEEFVRVSDRLIQHGIEFIRKPGLRFINKGHEQHVLFVEDPSGYGIEIKSFTKVPVGSWT